MRADHRTKHAVDNTVNYKARLNTVLHCAGIVFHTVQSILHSGTSPQNVTQLGYSEAQGLDVPRGLNVQQWISGRFNVQMTGTEFLTHFKLAQMLPSRRFGTLGNTIFR